MVFTHLILSTIPISIFTYEEGVPENQPTRKYYASDKIIKENSMY
jgi:hypothetical protein